MCSTQEYKKKTVHIFYRFTTTNTKVQTGDSARMLANYSKENFVSLEPE